jgi:hypothetical protein
VGELLYKALRDGYNEYKLRKLNQSAWGEDRASNPAPAGASSPAPGGASN